MSKKTRIEVTTTAEGAAKLMGLTEVAGVKVLAVERADAPKVAGPQQQIDGLVSALAVFLLTPETRAYLDAHDRKGVEQALRAIRAAGGKEGLT